MNKTLLSLAVAGLALSAVQSTFAAGPAFAPQSTGDVSGLLPVLHFPTDKCGFFPLQEAYRLSTVSTTLGASVAPGACTAAVNRGWCGAAQETGAHYPAASLRSSGAPPAVAGHPRRGCDVRLLSALASRAAP